MTSAVIDYRNPPPLFDVGAVMAHHLAPRLLVLGIVLATIFAAGLLCRRHGANYTRGRLDPCRPRDVKMTANFDSSRGLDHEHRRPMRRAHGPPAMPGSDAGDLRSS